MLFADLLGYTGLTESYSRRGPDGVEQLKDALNDFFDGLEIAIEKAGGDIISFAGDSLLAMFPSEPEDSEASFALRAATCGLAAQRVLTSNDSTCGMGLQMRIGVEAGDIVLATVGGVEGRWEYIAVGDAVAHVGTVMQLAGPGDVVVGRDAWRLIASSSEAYSVDQGGHARLRAVHWDHPPKQATSLRMPDEACDALRRYIPRPVLDHVDANQPDWMLEFRRATTVFVGVSGIDYRTDSSISMLHAAVVAIQQVVAKLEGTIARAIVDDKGTYVLCIWGIPRLSHEDDAVRAVAAALAIRNEIATLGLTSGTGVATGAVLCGLTGGRSRVEYTVTGDAVNLAAKMMRPAAVGVLCDRATRDAAVKAIDFVPSDSIVVKGRESPIAVFRPISERARAERATGQGIVARKQAPLIGRTVERQRLLEAVESLTSGVGATCIVRGEAGVGKSRLIAEVIDAAERIGARCLVGRSDSVQRNVTYFAWRPILRQLLERSEARDPEVGCDCVAGLFADEPKWRSMLPLLNDVLSLGLPETDLTSTLDQRERANGTAEILVELIRRQAQSVPTVIVFEDAHQMDSLSWEVVDRLQGKAEPLLSLYAIRTGHVLDVDIGLRILSQANSIRIELESLPRQDTETLISDRLEVCTVSSELLSFVHGKTDGHPLFTEELAYLLRDLGVLHFDASHCDLRSDAEEEVRQLVPETVEGLVTARIDRLPIAEKTTLKVAAVLGREISADAIGAIHPERPTVDAIEGQFECFVRLDLLRRDARGGPGRYAFKHAITQEMTYRLLTSTQKRQTHRAAATWLEATRGDDLSEVYPLLAHHWTKADVPDKSVEYLYKAGLQAYNKYANKDAADLMEQAIAMLGRVDEGTVRHVRAECERVLGYARLWHGEVSKSQASLQRGLASLGQPIPSTALSLGASILIEMTRAAAIGLSGRLSGGVRAVPSEPERHAAMGNLRLSHIAYLNGDFALSIYTGLRCISFAERTEMSREGAIIFAALAPALGMIPLHSLARAYVRVSLAAAEAMNDPVTLVQVLLYTSMYGTGVGDLRTCLARMNRALEICREIGDSRRMEECLVVSGYVYYHSGNFERALENFVDMVHAGRRRGDRQTTAWGLLGVSRVRLAQGKAGEAIIALEDAGRLAAERVSLIEFHGQGSLARLLQGDFEAALTSAQLALKLIRKGRASSFSTLAGVASTTESFLELWHLSTRGRFTVDSAYLEIQTRHALRALKQFSRLFSVGLPRAKLLEGRYLAYQQRVGDALVAWKEGIAVATHLNTPYELAAAENLIKLHS